MATKKEDVPYSEKRGNCTKLNGLRLKSSNITRVVEDLVFLHLKVCHRMTIIFGIGIEEVIWDKRKVCDGISTPPTTIFPNLALLQRRQMGNKERRNNTNLNFSS